METFRRLYPYIAIYRHFFINIDMRSGYIVQSVAGRAVAARSVSTLLFSPQVTQTAAGVNQISRPILWPSRL